MKKILIFTVTAGNGHNACAKGMKNKLESMGQDIEVKLVDLLKSYSTALNTWVADGGYNFAVSKMPISYNYFYNHYKKSKPEHRYTCAAQGTVMSTIEGVLKEILEFKPDVIYCTHFYPAMAISNLRLYYDIPCKVIVSNLDYVNSPFWEATIGVDYFAIPNEDFIEECIEEGFSRGQLMPIGLPVDERTLLEVDKATARRELGLDENLPTIMVMFGGGFWSGGFKIFKDLIDCLKGRKVQVIMINGKNKKGFDKIEKMKFEDGIKVVNVGFTNKVPYYMSAADFIINKFGGTSVTEMINKHLPMVITEKLPEQERYNLVYMKEKGVAVSFKNKKELKQHVLNLIDNPEILQSMREKISPLRKNTINELAEFMLSLPQADYSKVEQDIDFKKVKKLVKKRMLEENKKELKNARQKGQKKKLEKVGG